MLRLRRASEVSLLETVSDELSDGHSTIDYSNVSSMARTMFRLEAIQRKATLRWTTALLTICCA